jgi:hypothetical protein
MVYLPSAFTEPRPELLIGHIDQERNVPRHRPGGSMVDEEAEIAALEAQSDADALAVAR